MALTEARPSRSAPSTDEEEPTKGRLARLRSVAGHDPLGARDEAWDWIGRLGAGIRRARAGSLADLGTLFAAGRPPANLDGPTEGRLVAWAAHPVADRALSALTRLWLPWAGKRFDAAAARGDNLMSPEVRYAGRALWPLHRFGSFEGKVSGFAFTTWVEKGKLDPATDVLVIDYDSVPSNPRLAIRSIRDELVQIVPGAHLGKMLWRSGHGEHASFTMLAYFALRSPVQA